MGIFLVLYSIIIISSAIGIPTVGDMNSLDCYVSGATNPANYQWFKGTISSGIHFTNVSQLQFSSLLASHAGLYTCQAIIGGV